ncbi:nucleotidyltransferase [Schinkia azotoformans]|uniref:nucleotidyltransferase n=1 Tax=Schinkia azotoformans TaxID=1454 RepID=UPI002E23A24F|nr:nucleotidyltransferase [Schinkia azotoformans]
MRAVGVVVEYNPFHNGHYYHIQESRKVTEADLVVAVMSGNFLQRGEPALVSKWARTKMALEGGADIVIELPYVFATQKAEVFAFGAVSLLHALEVDSICFGSESGDISSFQNTLKEMKARKGSFDQFIKQALEEGKSYPRAASDAFHALQFVDSGVDLSQPNNILGFHYVEAVDKLGSRIQPFTIQRTKAGYHDQHIADQHIASATSIRSSLFSERTNLEEIQNVIPGTTYSHLLSYKKSFGMFHHWENYYAYLKYKLLTSTPEEFRQIYEVEEGLENRLLQNITSAATFKEFMEKIKTKRYTWTRLQRLCVHILTNTSKSLMRENSEYPTYIRLLGTSLAGQGYLNSIKKKVAIPFVSRLASFSNEQVMLDIKASNVYASCLNEPYRSNMIKSEFSNPPIRYDQNNKQFL